MFLRAVQGSDEWVANRLAEAIKVRNTGVPQGRDRVPIGHDRIGFLSTRVQRPDRPGLDLLWDYFRGEPPLPWCADGWRDAVMPYLAMSRLNVAEMAVMSAVDCMTPISWGTAVDDDADGDQEAHLIASWNDLPLRVAEVAQQALLYGEGYALLGPSVDGGIPRITSEDTRACITRDDPLTGETVYGLKTAVDDWTGEQAWFLYGKGWVRKAVAVPGAGDRKWVQAVEGSTDTGRARIPGHGDWCALHRVENRNGVGEFERHLGSADRITDGVFSRIVIAKFQAHRQRGIEGLPDTQVDPATGEEVEVDYTDAFMADPGSLWRLPEGAKIWESQPIDLGPIRQASLDDVKTFCALTSTPVFYLFPDEQQSAAGAWNQAQAHETRVLDRRSRMGGFQARLLGHAFEAVGDMARADPSRLRVEWGPVRRYSPGEQAQMMTAFAAGGVPWEDRMLRVLQLRPADMPRLQAMRARDLMYASTMSELVPSSAGVAGAAAASRREVRALPAPGVAAAAPPDEGGEDGGVNPGGGGG